MPPNQDRENLLLMTLDGHRLHGKQAQPLCFARDEPRFRHRVQLGLACLVVTGPYGSSRLTLRFIFPPQLSFHNNLRARLP